MPDADTAVDCGTKLVPVRTTVALNSLVTVVGDSKSPVSVEGAKEAESTPVPAEEVKSPSMPEGEPVPLGDTPAPSGAEPELLTEPPPDADAVLFCGVEPSPVTDGEPKPTPDPNAVLVVVVGNISRVVLNPPAPETDAVPVGDSDPEPPTDASLGPDAVLVCDASSSVPVGKALVPPREGSDGGTEPVTEPMSEMSTPVA